MVIDISQTHKEMLHVMSHCSLINTNEYNEKQTRKKKEKTKNTVHVEQ